MKNESELDDSLFIKHDEKIVLPKDIGTDFSFKRKIVWFNAIGFLLLHLAALYGFYRVIYCRILTIIFSFLVGIISGLGVTFGAHRMYSHKAFIGTKAVRFVAILLHTIAGQNCLYIWVRDHRQHHKYSDTDADPHNASRGFFFSHIGWLMTRKHPLVITKGKQIDLSDLEADELVMLQKKYYKIWYTIFALAFPILVPVYFFNESYINAIFVSYFLRYLIVLNITWAINSANHIYGTKPYDKYMNAVENRVISFLALGEGWHNYHHAFPTDYRAGEFGLKYSLTTMLIDGLARMKLISHLQETPKRSVLRRTVRTGDGSHPRNKFQKSSTAFNSLIIKENPLDINSNPLKDIMEVKG